MQLGMLFLILGALVIFFEKAKPNQDVHYHYVNALPATAESTYRTVCMRCHNANPNLKGPIGPDLVSTPLEVFKTKVPTGQYPSGYEPKRKTKIMPKFPQYKEEQVKELYDYIQTFKGK